MPHFLAIDLPVETKESIATQLIPFIKRYPAFEWVEPQKYHITLQYYGETLPSEDFIQNVENAIFEDQPFEISLRSGVGFMRGQMIFALTINRSQPLSALIRKLDALNGYSRTLSFFPHITIAKARVPAKQQYLLLKRKFEKIRIHDEFEVKDMTLYQSVPTKNGTEYKDMHTFPFYTDEDLLSGEVVAAEEQE